MIFIVDLNHDLNRFKALDLNQIHPERRFTKMIINMEGKSYEERLYCLKLWALEERRNRQDLIEVFKMCNGLSRLKLNEFFYPSR